MRALTEVQTRNTELVQENRRLTKQLGVLSSTSINETKRYVWENCKLVGTGKLCSLCGSLASLHK